MERMLRTPDFISELGNARKAVLRERFLWWVALVAGLTILFTFARLWKELVQPIARALRGRGPDWQPDQLALIAPELLKISVFGYFAWVLWRGGAKARDLVARAEEHGYWLLVGVSAACMLLMSIISVLVGSGERTLNALFGPIETVFVMHLSASLLLGWTARDAFRPCAGLLAMNIGLMALLGLREDGFWQMVQAALAGALGGAVFLPGIAGAFWMTRRFEEAFRARFFESRYGQVRQELVDARALHEALFPQPARSGSVWFEYTYEPMRQIGGDYLYARFVATSAGTASAMSEQDDPDIDRPLHVLVLDVTGHGIAAAITVNRIFGEVERLFAETPDAPPGQVLKLLNRYVYLTLANHGLFLTALCVRVDPASRQVAYASGGHPPAFIRRSDGRIERLDATTVMLGVFRDGEFNSAQRTLDMNPGDVLLAYTDGALEATSNDGEAFGLDRISAFVSQPGRGPGEAFAPDGTPEPGAWCRGLLRSVASYRHGPARDDTLVIEVGIERERSTAAAGARMTATEQQA
jgi:serine phosphatase RsbU (regulator of sigma subunit)